MLRDRFPAPCSPLCIVFVVCLWGFCCCFVCLVCCCCFGGDVFFCFYLAFGKSEARRGWSVIHWLGWWGWGTCLNIALLSLVLVEGAMGVTYKGCSVPWLWGCPPILPPLACFSVQLISSDMDLLQGCECGTSKFIYNLVRILCSCVWALQVAAGFSAVRIVRHGPQSHTAQSYTSNWTAYFHHRHSSCCSAETPGRILRARTGLGSLSEPNNDHSHWSGSVCCLLSGYGVISCVQQPTHCYWKTKFFSSPNFFQNYFYLSTHLTPLSFFLSL